MNLTMLMIMKTSRKQQRTIMVNNNNSNVVVVSALEEVTKGVDESEHVEELVDSEMIILVEQEGELELELEEGFNKEKRLLI